MPNIDGVAKLSFQPNRLPTTKPLVSIIVNVYNGEKYLAECLDSIIALEGNYPLQVIVTDDGSTDQTPKICALYAAPNIEIIRIEPNIGAAAAINRAFENVRGQLVARIDYDDRYHPNFLVDSVSALSAHPDAAFVCSSVVIIDPDGVPTEKAGPEDYFEAPGCSDRFVSMLQRNFVTAPTILGRMAHWRKALPIPDRMDFCDWYMNLVMAEGAPVVVADSISADYRVHPLGMHLTKVVSGMGERVTFQVLDRFLSASPRSGELVRVSAKILGRHYADWGDKYFSAGLNKDSRRCYLAAIQKHPPLAVSGGFIHRLVALLLNRNLYERLKGIVKKW